MSSLSLAELQRGFYKVDTVAALRRSRLQVLLSRIPILAFDAAAAEAYGDILRICGWSKGRDYDRLIAAHAITTGSTLVTNNATDFVGIPGLRIENWV
jgi:tRNA(fMet)-specific endonuclease VapC